MPKIRIISGKELIQILQKEGFVIVRQKGSHVRLAYGESFHLTVPLHSEIDRGTLRSIIRYIERIIPHEKLLEMFYN